MSEEFDYDLIKMKVQETENAYEAPLPAASTLSRYHDSLFSKEAYLALEQSSDLSRVERTIAGLNDEELAAWASMMTNLKNGDNPRWDFDWFYRQAEEYRRQCQKKKPVGKISASIQ